MLYVLACALLHTQLHNVIGVGDSSLPHEGRRDQKHWRPVQHGEHEHYHQESFERNHWVEFWQMAQRREEVTTIRRRGIEQAKQERWINNDNV